MPLSGLARLSTQLPLSFRCSYFTLATTSICPQKPILIRRVGSRASFPFFARPVRLAHDFLIIPILKYIPGLGDNPFVRMVRPCHSIALVVSVLTGNTSPNKNLVVLAVHAHGRSQSSDGTQAQACVIKPL